MEGGQVNKELGWKEEKKARAACEPSKGVAAEEQQAQFLSSVDEGDEDKDIAAEDFTQHSSGQQAFGDGIGDDLLKAGRRQSPSASTLAIHPILHILFGHDTGPGIGAGSPSKLVRAHDSEAPEQTASDASSVRDAVEVPKTPQERVACASCRFFGIHYWCANATSSALQVKSDNPTNRSRLHRFRALSQDLDYCAQEAGEQEESALLDPVPLGNGAEAAADEVHDGTRANSPPTSGHGSMEVSAWEMAIVREAEHAAVEIQVTDKCNAIFLPELDISDAYLDDLSEIREREDDEDGDFHFELSALDMQVHLASSVYNCTTLSCSADVCAVC